MLLRREAVSWLSSSISLIRATVMGLSSLSEYSSYSDRREIPARTAAEVIWPSCPTAVMLFAAVIASVFIRNQLLQAVCIPASVPQTPVERAARSSVQVRQLNVVFVVRFSGRFAGGLL